jgi:hypothetical protein
VKKRELAERFLPIMRQELPGIRSDLHRKLANRISCLVADDVERVEETNRKLSAELAAERRKKNRKYDFSGIIRTLQQIQETTNGQEK